MKNLKADPTVAVLIPPKLRKWDWTLTSTEFNHSIDEVSAVMKARCPGGTGWNPWQYFTNQYDRLKAKKVKNPRHLASDGELLNY